MSSWGATFFFEKWEEVVDSSRVGVRLTEKSSDYGGYWCALPSSSAEDR